MVERIIAKVQWPILRGLCVQSPEDPSLDVANNIIVRFARIALAETDLKHSKQTDDCIEGIVFSLGKSATDGVLKLGLNCDLISACPVEQR